VGECDSSARTNWRTFLPIILAKINSTKANIFGGIFIIRVSVRWSLHGIRYKETYSSHLKASRTFEDGANMLFRNVCNYESTMRNIPEKRRFIYAAAEA